MKIAAIITIFLIFSSIYSVRIQSSSKESVEPAMRESTTSVAYNYDNNREQTTTQEKIGAAGMNRTPRIVQSLKSLGNERYDN